LGLAAPQAAAKEAPEAVKTAIEKGFPGAAIKGLKHEREDKVAYDDVTIVWKDQEIEVEVAADGALGEVSQALKETDLPADVAAKIKTLIGAGKLKEIERTEVRGVPKGTTFAPQTPATIVYGIKYTDPVKKKTVEARLGADGAVIPRGADDAEDDDGGDEENHEHGHQDRK
jgi:hypothetical protein